ncbi:MAG: hypothetical protein A3K10_13730 [Bacteroidetes bacterium RIFCSPLOWO2_12_FULL_31_6]|nr:MAG: hypothetical protein A3K10_13730 [Bacteroidetes bacterium RIFCSPLOWO2_12_FULL_31_6]
MLEKIYIEQTELTPLIDFDLQKSIMKIKGISVPEDAYTFYNPILNWIKIYKKKPIENSIFEFELDYFNTSSSKFLLEIMKKIKKIPHQKIIWTLYSDDEDILEVVHDYNSLLGNIITLNIKERKLTIQLANE